MILQGRAFQVMINCATRADLFAKVQQRWADGTGFALATINLDHVVKLESDEAFRSAYAAQDLVVADGNPIVWTSKVAKAPVDLIPGSELVLPLAQMARDAGVSVGLVGSTDEALEGAAARLQRDVPGLEIGLTIAPAYGFDPEGDDARDILRHVADSGVKLVFLALGAPKQERFAALGRELAPHVGFASVGAGLDFLAGHQTRAPKWVQAIAMEWLWRMLSNPRRLVKRYALCALVLPGLMWRSRSQ